MRIVKRIVIILSALFALTFVILFLIGYFYNVEISTYIIEQVNQNLNAKVKIGNVKFSLIKKFPNASLEFDNVTVTSSNDFLLKNKQLKNSLLLNTQSISLEFNLFYLLKKEIYLSQIIIKNGSLNIYRDHNNNFNFYVIRSNSSGKTSFHTNLKKIKVINTEIAYNDYIEQLKLTSKFNNLSLNLSLNEKDFSAKLKTSVESFDLCFKDDTLARNKRIDLDSELKGMDKIVRIKCTSTIDHFKWNFSGSFDVSKSLVDIAYKIKNQKIKDFIKVFPIKNASKISNGRITSYGTVKWAPSFKYPVIDAVFKIDNAKINSIVKIDYLVAEFRISINSYNDLTKASLEIKNLTINNDSFSLEANGYIHNFENPFINGSIKSKGMAKSINGIIPSKFRFISGNFDLSVELKGFYKEIKNATLNSFIYKGSSDLNNISIQYESNTISNIDGSIDFSNKDLILNDLSFMYDSNTYKYSGKILNLPDYLENKQNLVISGKVSSPSIKIKRSSNDTNTLYLPKRIELSLNLHAGEFKLNSHHFKNITTSILINSDSINLRNTHLECFNGRAQIKNIDIKRISDKFSIRSEGFLKNIDIQKLFHQYNDFDQSFISYKNLSGSLTGNYSMSAITDIYFNFNKDEFELNADVVINKGNIVNLKPLENLSSFIDINELKNVKFSTLKNTIQIKNGLITIPQMEVSSSACNLNVFGTHSFDNSYEYHIQIVLSELLSKKHKNNLDNEFNNVTDDDDLKKRLLLKIVGKDDDFKVSYDKAEAIHKMKEKFLKEKHTFKNIIKNEFSSTSNKQVTSEEENNKKGKIHVIFSDDTVPATQTPKTNELKNKKKVKLEWKDE